MLRNFLRASLGAMLLILVAGAVLADTGLARHKKLYVVPAPGPVTIDGKLDDWDLSGQIGMYVVSETSDMQSAKFALMYDSKYLYVSGVVRDPSPMMNRHDPKADADKGWNADSCQFRLSLDPSLPYPINIGYGIGNEDNPNLVHLTLWYYTDKQEPALDIQNTMHFKSPRPEWAPFGAVPPSDFQAKYVKMADGRGYTFEYAIPWSTLGAKKPLKGGDLVAGTVQFSWSTPDGFTTAGGSAWAYDLMDTPGFPYQSTACWGKMIFSAKGNLPRSIVEAGVAPEKPLPLKFAYTLPKDSQVTLQLMDKDNVVRRILVAQGNRPAGKNVELWDGMNDQGQPLPASQYTVKGIYHDPITQKYLFSPHNSGQPPYKTDDGTGGWGGDEGNPEAVVSVGDGLIMSWGGAEAGSGLIRTDLNGHRKWGTLHDATLLATDGTRVFAAGDGFFNNGIGVIALAAADSRPMPFGNGGSTLLPPPNGSDDANNVTGLAYAKGLVYVAFQARNLIALYDATSGDPKGTWTVPSPGNLAALADGTLIGVSSGSLVHLAGGNATPFASTHLDDPRGIAVGPDGTVYVANGGKLQSISVFDATGAYVRNIGIPGGRPLVGKYDRNGVLEPGGIAIDSNNHLWVAEMLDAPKRISEWDAKTGAFVNEFFGSCSYFGYSYIDPRKPDEIYCHNVIWSIDWKNNTCAPVSTIWRPTTPNMMYSTGEAGYQEHPIFFTAKNGKQYAYGNAGSFTSVLTMRQGNIYKPFAALITLSRGNVYYGATVQFPVMTDEKAYPNGVYFWQDANDDQTVQASELTPVSDLGAQFGNVDGDLGLWCGQKLLKPIRLEADGRPVYSLTNAGLNPGAKLPGGVQWVDPYDGDIYDRADMLGKYTPDGKQLWAFPGMRDWESSLSMPIQAPGRLYGLTNVLGVAGDFTGNSDYFGPYHIFTREGIYVGMLMRDGRDGKGMGPDITASETLTGELVKPDGMDRYFLLAGAADARVTEIFGLDTVKLLPESTLTLSDADVKVASDAQLKYAALISRSKPLSIARGGLAGLSSAEPATKTLDSSRSFSAAAAYDEDNLYISFNVTAPNDLINSQPDPEVLFKGGNCVDIQLGTDTKADGARKTPAAGDIRILVTRQVPAAGGPPVPIAVIYRPVVSGFAGAAHILRSPTGTESFDVIEQTDKVTLNYTKTGGGYTAQITIPNSVSGLSLKPGVIVKCDLGVIYGNITGNQTSARSYWSNNSFSANVTNDVPNEARLEPAEWGTAVAE